MELYQFQIFLKGKSGDLKENLIEGLTSKLRKEVSWGGDSGCFFEEVSCLVVWLEVEITQFLCVDSYHVTKYRGGYK